MRLCVPALLLAAFALSTRLPFAGGQGQDKPDPIVAAVKAAVKDPTKPFTMLVRFRTREGAEPKFEAAFAKAVKATRAEKGCLAYDLNRDPRAATQYLLYERWRDLRSLEAHLKAAHITALLKEVGALLAGPPEVQVLTPVGE
jgi:quinol monooxygenase YgiN